MRIEEEKQGDDQKSQISRATKLSKVSVRTPATNPQAPGSQVMRAAATNQEVVGKAPSQISKASKQPSQRTTSFRQAAGEIMSQRSNKTYVTSSIRTTTTTRERLAEIERQLQEETEKRIAAEKAIIALTRGKDI